MTEKINLILGSHAHIFPSASDEEFEELYQTRLKPFITILNQYPRIPFTLHYSGFLFNRLEQKKPELFLLIKDMAERKQLEFLGGGFYEPLIPFLPPADRIGQIEMLTTYIRQNFGRRPQGCLLSHSVWEQSLVGVLDTCGMAYTFLSTEQFSLAGYKAEQLLSPVCTEDQGKLLIIFPVFSFLARMGKESAWTVLQKSKLFLNEGSEKGAVITVFPDFSPDNTEHEIHSFFEDLSTVLADKTKNLNLELTTPGKIYRYAAVFPRLYFIPSGDVSCPQPRSFLSRYPEANELYARIHFVHSLINQLRGDKSRKRSAREELWKAEGAETLLSVGNRDVRRHAQKAILASERIIREKDFKPSLLNFDFDLDRTEEYLFQDKNINCYVRTRGAAVFEFDYLPKGWNYVDSFDENHEKRCAFVDMLFPGDFIPQPDLLSEAYFSMGAFPANKNSRFCGSEEYRLLSADRTKLKASFVLSPRKGLSFGSIEILKSYSLEKNILQLSYKLCNKGEEKTILCFIPRFDLALTGDQLLFRRSQGEEEYSPETKGEKRRVLAFEEQSSRHGAAISVAFLSPCDLYYREFEKSPQSRCFLPVFQIFLNPGDSWENRITVSVSAKAKKN